MTIKEMKKRIDYITGQKHGQKFLAQEEEKALNSYYHMFCPTNKNNVAFIVTHKDESLSIEFKSRAKKSDYNAIMEMLESMFGYR